MRSVRVMLRWSLGTVSLCNSSLLHGCLSTVAKTVISSRISHSHDTPRLKGQPRSAVDPDTSLELAETFHIIPTASSLTIVLFHATNIFTALKVKQALLVSLCYHGITTTSTRHAHATNTPSTARWSDPPRSDACTSRS